MHSFTATRNDHDKLALTGNNRSINRHVWEADELAEKLRSPGSHHKIVFERMKALLALRRAQPAFHPNATQYTLHLGEGLFCFWRQSRRREQSIFCVNNISNEEKTFTLSGLNLVETDSWTDLFTGRHYEDFRETVTLRPYQCLWLTNWLPR